MRGNRDAGGGHLFIFYNDFYFFHYSWLTVLCQFLLYGKVTQSYIYIDSFFFPLSSIMFHHKWLHIVPCAIYTAGSYHLSTPNAIVTFKCLVAFCRRTQKNVQLMGTTQWEIILWITTFVIKRGSFMKTQHVVMSRVFYFPSTRKTENIAPL